MESDFFLAISHSFVMSTRTWADFPPQIWQMRWPKHKPWIMAQNVFMIIIIMDEASVEG